jgi:large subunit ribosomal protein L21
MYAVVDVAAYQFKVAEGEIIDAPKLDKEVGQSFDVNEVLLVVDGDKVKVGTPLVKGAKVTFEVIRQFKGEKDISFTYRRRKDTRKKIGHREELTALKVAKITA